MSVAARILAAAGLLLAASCAVLPTSPPPAPDASRVQAQLLQDEAETRTVRGLARVAFEGPDGSGTASQVVVVALPDSARLETLTPLGTTALVATLRNGDLRMHSPLRREYAAGRATRQALARLIAVPVPPEPLLRLLAGLPPLPLRAGDPRLTVADEAARVRVESVDGEYWQRLWTGVGETSVARGEVGRGSDVLFTFAFSDRRSADGRSFPFELRVEDASRQSHLRLQYERVELNVPVEAGLFGLSPPADPETKIMDLRGGAAPRRGSPRE